jgi:hypothetical protein
MARARSTPACALSVVAGPRAIHEDRPMAEHQQQGGAEKAATPAKGAVLEPTPVTLGEHVLALQRSVGNRAVGRLVQRQSATAAQSSWDAAEFDALVSYSRSREAAIAAAESPGDAGLKAAAHAAKREAIVKLALSQVGKVLDAPGPDGGKVGWERLREFYRVACPGYKPQYDWGIKTLNMWAGQKPGDDPKKDRKGPWSWCAIFGVWAINSVIGFGKFDQVPIGLGPVHFFYKYKTPLERAQAVKPGDMICRKEEWQIAGLTEKPKGVDNVNHQCLVASVDVSDEKDPQVTTINGNGLNQAIHIRTESINKYWAFYDSLSQVP